MVTEKEFNIIKALVEEEIGSFGSAECLDSDVITNYLFTLSDIIEKLKEDLPKNEDFLRQDSISIR
jgi:hypothetical protein